MRKRWGMFVMGAWLTGLLIFSFVAAENFYMVDRLLARLGNRTFASLVAGLGQPQARELLRYLSSELNRFYFQLWNFTQIALGIAALALIGSRQSSAKARWGVVAMLGLVVLMVTWLAPEIVSVGRSLDFVPRDPPPPALNRFWILHGAYTLLEGCKLVVGVIVSVWIDRGVARLEAGRAAN